MFAIDPKSKLQSYQTFFVDVVFASEVLEFAAFDCHRAPWTFQSAAVHKYGA
jgi:hypothetical protein